MSEVKFALITDIHGNAEALRAVLQHIDQQNVQAIYCTGDLIAIGHETNEVLELLTNLNNCYFVSGNHDEAIVTLFESLPYPKSHESTRNHHEWILHNLDKSFIPFLKQLPREMSKQFGSKHFLFTHYALRGKQKMFHEHPFESIVDPSLENMETLFQQYKGYDCICFGHHHPTHLFQNNQSMFINPGSLGCNGGTFAKYGLCTINDTIDFQIIKVNYNYERFIEDFKATNIPDKDFILDTFYKV